MNLVDFVPNYVPIGADKIFNGEGTRTCGYLSNKFIFFAGAARAKFFFYQIQPPATYLIYRYSSNWNARYSHT